MNFATWSIRNPIPSILLFLLLTLAGLWGFSQLRIQDFPDLDLPVVNVALRLPGAAPGQLETEVARTVENSMATLTGLKHIYTTINTGVANISVEFDLGVELSQALTDVKDAVDRVRSDLPTDLEQPQVSKVTVGPGGPILTYAINSDRMDEQALSWFVDDELERSILSVPGVGEFTRVGGVQREVKVRVDPVRLDALGVTTLDVSRGLRSVQQEASGGRGQLGGAEQGVRTLATVQTADGLRSLPIVLADGRSFRLDQVASVEDTVADPSQAARLDGQPVVGFRISRTKGFDETTIADKVEAVLAELKQSHPGLQTTLVSSTVSHTLEQYHGSMEMLVEGAVLAVLVIWLFLRDFRATLIGAVALPLSIIPTFAFMNWAGYSLNTITLLALAVVVGILVDDAIVEVENVERHVRQGKPVRQATEDAVQEIALAVTATTATLVVVFLPTAFMSGIPGLVFKQFGWTIVIAVIFSWMVARIVTPLMAVWLVKAEDANHEKKKEEKEGRVMKRYLRAVNWCLLHRKTTVALGGVFFIASMALVPLLPTGFIPPSDSGTTVVSIELPTGSGLQDAMAVAERARVAVAQIEGVTRVFASAGNSTQQQAGEVRKASLTVNMAERGERPDQQVIEDRMRKALGDVPGARFSISGGGPGTQLELILKSADSSQLNAAARRIEAQLRDIRYLSGITSTASVERSEIIVRPDPQRAADRGVSTAAIGETLRVALSGDFDAALPKLNLERRQIDIRVQLPESVRTDLQALSMLRVPGRNGTLVPLSSVADISVGSGPTQIDRYDRQRQVTINADLGGYPLGDALKQARALPAVKNLPAGVELFESGDAETQGELFLGFAVALVTGVFCVYCVLVLLFKDWFQPVTILSAVPLSVGGAFIALLMTGGQLSLPALIGLVMLLGIVTKNSILLVDFAVMALEGTTGSAAGDGDGKKEQGLSRHDALVDACRKRARPILMTTVAMVAGMLPLAIGFGGDPSFRQPMAIAVIGGLISSTLLSLLVVPVVFTVIGDLEAWLKARVRKKPPQPATRPEPYEA